MAVPTLPLPVMGSCKQSRHLEQGQQLLERASLMM